MDKIIEIENMSYRNNKYVIRWNMTKLCNYYCDFCIQGNKNKHLNDSIDENSGTRKIICDKIIYFIENELEGLYDNVSVYLIGGEVTLLNDFLIIVSRIVNSKFSGNIKIHITTNLSKNIDYLNELQKIFIGIDNRYLSLSASYYKEFTSYKQFIKKINTFKLNNFIKRFICKKTNNKMFSKKSNINLNISYPLICDGDYKKYKIFKFRQIIKRILYTSNYKVNYIIIRNYKKTISNELLEKLKNNKYKNIKVTFEKNSIKYFSSITEMGHQLYNNRIFNPYGYICDSGINNISIDNKGMVFRCPSYKNKDEMYSLFTNDLKMNDEPFVCLNSNCTCNYFKKIRLGRRD